MSSLRILILTLVLLVAMLAIAGCFASALLVGARIVEAAAPAVVEMISAYFAAILLLGLIFAFIVILIKPPIWTIWFLLGGYESIIASLWDA